MTAPAMSSAWRRALPAITLVLTALLWVYRDTAAAMVAMWSRNDTFAHAFLVPPIVLWLIWRRRDFLRSLSPEPQPWALLPMAVTALMWLLAELVAVNAATQFALTALVVLAVPAMLGMAVTRALLFPLAFLFFSVPIGEFMMPAMMDWTADFTVLALQLSGIPVHREGLQFSIPSGNWSVVEACSGVRYLIASFMVGTLFGYLNYRSNKRRWIFAAFSLVVPVVANWLRAYIIVMLGHLSGNRLAAGVDHLVYGWVFFGIVIMVMFMVGMRWSEAPEDAPVAAQEALAAPGPTAGASSAAGWLTIACAAALVIMPHVVLNLLERAESKVTAQVSLPDRLGLWNVSSDGAKWKPRFENASSEAQRVYASGAGQVGVYLAYYRQQDYQRKLVSSENRLVSSTDSAWNRLDAGTRQVDWGGRRVNLKTALFRTPPWVQNRSEEHLLVWHVYWIDGRWVSGDAWAKLLNALHRLAGRGDDGASVVLYAIGPDPAALERLLEVFARENAQALEVRLADTRARR